MQLGRLKHIGVAMPFVSISLPSQGRIYMAQSKHYNDLVM
jgi:hypothetical protein